MLIIERIFDATTGETKDIEREMNAQELKDYNAAIERNSKEIAEAAAKESARKTIFDKLGLTEEEARLLLG